MRSRPASGWQATGTSPFAMSLPTGTERTRGSWAARNWSPLRPPWLDPDQPWPLQRMDQVSLFSSLLAQQTETWLPRWQRMEHPTASRRFTRPAMTADLEKIRTRFGHGTWRRTTSWTSRLIQKQFADRQDQVVGHLDHVFVDEFQDTNPIQFKIPHRMARACWYSADGRGRRRPGALPVPWLRHPVLHRRQVRMRDTRRSVPAGETRRELAQHEAHCRFRSPVRERYSLARVSMPKTVVAPASTDIGSVPRFLSGNWEDVSMPWPPSWRRPARASCRPR